MTAEPLDAFDPELLRDIAADLRGELDRVQDQMADLTARHERARALKHIFGGDPVQPAAAAESGLSRKERR
ncbi:MAG: hypothetical protein E6I88_14675 [Chloroflexi bacterium]|nr:MAG: hypothetical protein E6I88_14675 [Chloroflexota bacterium]